MINYELKAKAEYWGRMDKFWRLKKVTLNGVLGDYQADYDRAFAKGLTYKDAHARAMVTCKETLV